MQIFDAITALHNKDLSEDLRIETAEKIMTLPDEQNSDYDLEQILDESQRIEDDIEISEEFKPLFIDNNNHTTSNDSNVPCSNIKQTYCPKCHESKKYSSNQSTLCVKCKTVLKYKCGKCLTVYTLIAGLNSHLLRHKRPKLSCNHCDYKSIHRGNLRKHIQVCHVPRNPNMNKCSKWARNFSAPWTLNKHFKICGLSPESRKSLPLRFCCDHCQYKSNQKINLIGHIQRKHLPNDLNLNRCDKCGKSFTKISRLRYHSKYCGLTADLKRLLSNLSCDHCDYKTNRKDNLVCHIQAKHLLQDSNLNCDKCGKKNFSSITGLRSHLKICSLSEDQKNALKRHCCNQCSFKTIRKTHLTEHIQAKHQPRDPNNNKCEKCGKSFAYKHYLKRHSCSATSIPKSSTKTFNCNDCDFKTGWRSGIVQHIRDKHSNMDMKKCGKCGKNFAPSKFTNHSKLCGIPADLKFSQKFTCDDCKSIFNSKKGLVLHIKTKHLPRDLSIKCNKCKKIFSDRSYLKIHSQTCGQPKGLTPNKCNKCGKSYSKKRILVTHSKICGLSRAPKPKNLSCDHCDYKANAKGHLIRHIQAKHLPRDSKSSKCGKCAKQFAYQNDLIKHLKVCGLPSHLRPKRLSCDHCEYKTDAKAGALWR